MKYKIYNDDIVGWAKSYTKTKFHALLCDPPYHLTSITKRFGKNGSKPAQYGEDGAFQRASKGFMQTTWDGGDVAFDPETWKAIGNVLYDGAFGMAFSASRNWHRLAVAIEDAGFIIHPTIFLWAYGQGFPKATNIHKQISRDKGVWLGHRYGLQALKPAVEPIIVFQKPYNGKPIDNITQTGAGALNIDGSRIPSEPYTINTWDDDAHPFGNGAGNKFTGRQQEGRWPSNLILDEVAAEHLDEQTGTLTSGKPSGKKHADNHIYGQYKNEDIDVTGFGDSGGASRFFYTVSSRLDKTDPVYYCSKTSQKERNAGLDGKNVHPTLKPIELCKYLATLLLPPDEYNPRKILVPFSGVASEMVGCGLAGWEQIVGVEFDTDNGYVDIAERRLEHWLK